MGLTTLCYIERDGKYLMMHRTAKEKDINKEKWIGVGGHFEAYESPEECLLREVKEETGLDLVRYRLRGIVTFVTHIGQDAWVSEYMFLYTADAYTGTLAPCDEGTLEWVEKSKIFDLNIWEGDRIFFRLIEENRPFFSLKLEYEKDSLRVACLDGEELPILETRI